MDAALARTAPLGGTGTVLLCALLSAPGCTSTAPLAGEGNAPPPEGDYWQANTLVAEDRVYRPGIAAVQLFPEDHELAPPIIELGSAERVVLRFDDLSLDELPLSYALVHCDAQWNPSGLPPGLYLEGATSDFLPPPRYSTNTLAPFAHYELLWPTPNMRPTRSGNYLLQVYRNDPQDLVLTRRLLVHERLVEVEARVVPTRRADLSDFAQQVDLVLHHPRLPNLEVFGDLHVTLLQNMRWDDARTGLQPRFTRGTELVYDFPEKGLFMGGNEFRNVDLQDLRFASQRVARLEERPDMVHTFLLPEPKRNISVYLPQPDLNGRFLIGHRLFAGDPLAADHTMVHFTLPMPEALGEAVYLYGAFTDFRCQRAYRMEWNEGLRAYTLAVPLKQGFYDYAFAVQDRNGAADLTRIEGSHFRTGNEYQVLVYYSDRGQRYDRLVGVQAVKSRL
jgi:hypothetical protein